MRRVLTALVITACVGMAACGDDDDDAGTPATGDSTETSAASDTTAAGAGGTTDTGGGTPEGEPIRIAWFAPETGPNAIEGRHNAIELAIAEINAAGGVLGRPLEYEAYDSQFTPDQAVTATELALSEDPDVLMGYFVTAQVRAIQSMVDEAGLPLLQFTQSDITNFSGLGMERAYRMNVVGSEQVAAAVRYVLDEVQPETVGLLYSSDDSSHQSGVLYQQLFEDAGVEVVAREVPADSTDLTEAVLAMTDVDVTVGNSFPNIESLFIRQLEQNGVSVPHVTSFSGAQVLTGQLNPPEELRNLRFITACDALVFEGPAMDAFRAAYTAEHGTLEVGLNGTGTPAGYDGVHFLAAAIEAAGSTDPAAVGAALGEVSHPGICGTVTADEEHNLMHAMGVVGTSDGTIGGAELLAYYPG